MNPSFAAMRHARSLWPFDRPSVPVVLGTLCLLLAAALAGGLSPVWQAERIDAEARQAARVRSTPTAAQGSTPAVRPSAATALVLALPGASQAHQRMAELSNLAQRHGVTVQGLRQGQAVLAVGPAGHVVQRLPISQVAQGPYPALRRFVAEALQHDDALLLERLRLSRSAPDADEVAADLQWALLQRAGPPGQRP